MWSTLSDHPEILYGTALAFAIVVLLTPAVGGMARLLGVVDQPGGRRLNRHAVPRLGGIALFFGIFVPALAFLPLGRETKGLPASLLRAHHGQTFVIPIASPNVCSLNLANAVSIVVYEALRQLGA